jgi:hypothetical protein
LADRAPETVARLAQELGVTISRRELLTRSGMAAPGGTLGGLIALGLDPERGRAATVPLAVAPASNVNWEVD